MTEQEQTNNTVEASVEQIANAYVDRVEKIEDIQEASAWAKEEYGDMDPSKAEEAAVLIHAKLKEKGLIPGTIESSEDENVEAPESTQEETSPEPEAQPQEDSKDADNA